MNDQREFDRAVDRWLDEGSDATPPRVIDAVLLAARTTPQERDLRTWWRALPMMRLGYAAAAVAALAIGVAALAALGPRFGIGPNPTPSQVPSVDLGIFEPVAGWIVYGDESGIWGVDPAVPADPATRVQLSSEAGIPLGWSSDGTRLLLMRGSSPEVQLFVLHADGSETQVTEAPMSIAGATISPDGSRVAFARGTGTGSVLYVVDAVGGPAAVLVGPQDDGIRAPTYSPDGTHIAYTDGGGDHSHHVRVIGADGSDAHEIVYNERTAAAGHVRGLAWSPAGDEIALGLEGRIYTFAADGSDFTQIAGGDTTCGSLSSCALNLPRSAESPYWSPDGSHIAYTTGCVEGAGSANRVGCTLAIADADGSDVLTFGFGASGPWHPGGSTLGREAPSSQPSTSELVLHFQSWWTGDEGATRREVAVYADGRVIWNGDEEVGYLEMQLMPEGIEALRSRAMSTGLFEHDLALGLDLDTGNMEVFRDDQSAMVAWGRSPANVTGLGLQDSFVEATPEQAGELTELEAFFRDPAAWGLPREMYRQAEVTPYVPTHLWVGYDRSRPDLSTLPSPAREIVTRHLEPAFSGGCGEISIDQAREVVDALVQAGVIAAVDDIRLGFEFELTQPRPSLVHLHPALPRASDCP